MKIILTKPIVAHGEQISAIDLREDINGKDIRLCGVLSKAEQGKNGPVSVPDMESATAWISQLANIPTSSVDQMAAADYLRAVVAVQSFFQRAESAAPPPSTATGN